jgi:hypothetical protein
VVDLLEDVYDIYKARFMRLTEREAEDFLQEAFDRMLRIGRVDGMVVWWKGSVEELFDAKDFVGFIKRIYGSNLVSLVREYED